MQITVEAKVLYNQKKNFVMEELNDDICLAVDRCH